MKRSFQALGLAFMVLSCVALFIPGDVSWGQDFFVVGAGSPWQRNGTNIYYNGGNVGIGTTSPLYPLQVQSSGPALYAVQVQNFGTGIYTESRNSSYYGILGANTATSGPGTGVYGFSNPPDNPGAAGVLGVASGLGAGVRGYTASASGYGVYGENSGVNGTAIYGLSSAINGGGFGVAGSTNSNAASAAGVYGSATNGYGVNGVSTTGFGVVGFSISGSGVYGVGGSYGVYCDGNFFCTGNATILGSKSGALMPTSQGNRKLYMQESPEVWFEDFGEGQLQGGKAHINLDPLFLETVTVDDHHPLKVFVQLNDDCNGVYVQSQATGFQVKELKGGTSHAHFTYRVVAKRKGFESARLEAVPETPAPVAALKAPQK